MNTIHPPHSQAVQDYLRALYQLIGLEPDNPRVSTTRLAAWLGVRPASVTAMLQKMAAARPALVDYHKSHGARLTAAGEQAALTVVRYHRLLEAYLHQKLGYTWDEVHEEADRLEHAISEELAERLSAALGHPTRDPHGHVIPSAALEIDQPATFALSDLEPGETAIVRHVRDEEPALLRYLAGVGIQPGASVVALRRDLPAARLWVSLDGHAPIALGPEVTGRVFLSVPSRDGDCVSEPTINHLTTEIGEQ
jgi:DtxR family Mn-dependent transcriptional regulator